MKSEKVYHIYSRSSTVVFRGEDDYLMAINRLAACAAFTGTKILAYAIMSTHFHLVVRSCDPQPFILRYKRCVAIWHKTRYKKQIKVQVSTRELHNPNEIRTALDYVLKNPIHHNVAMLAVQYPYSSAHCYFQDKLKREAFYTNEVQSYDLHRYSQAAELTWETRRRIFGKYVPDGDLVIQDNRVVVPSSFVDLAAVQVIYNHERNFSYHMTKPLEEELETFEDKVGGPGHKQAILRLCEKLGDREVCEKIDRSIAPQTYAQLTPKQKDELWPRLYKQGVSRTQFDRCI